MRKLAIAVTVGLAIGYALAQRQAAAERAELAEFRAAKGKQTAFFRAGIERGKKFDADMKRQAQWLQEALDNE